VIAFNQGNNNPQVAEQVGGSVKLDWDLNDTLTLTSITAFESAEDSSRGDIDGGNPAGPAFTLFQTESEDFIDSLDQFTQELRLSSNASDSLFWQAGVFYFDSEADIGTNPFFIPATVARYSNTAWAVFGQFSYDMSDTWNLTAGIRYTDDEKDLIESPINMGNPVTSVNVQDDQVSWDVSLIYAASDNINWYGRIASGFRGPSIQGRDLAFGGPPSTARSETITSGEIGFKSNLNNDRLRINGSVFAYQLDDQQISAVGGTGNSIQLVNADKTNGFGFELEVEALLTDNFLVELGVGYNDTEIDDPNLRIATCGALNASFEQACTPTDPLVDIGGSEFAVVDGNTLPNAPEWNTNLRAQYTIPLNAGEVYLAADWMYQSDMHFPIYDTIEYNSDGTHELGVRAGFAAASGRWDVAVFGRNITDEENLKGTIDFNNNTGFVNDRRIWGATFRVNFGSL
jgi:iron complex outermembrane receptor protein